MTPPKVGDRVTVTYSGIVASVEDEALIVTEGAYLQLLNLDYPGVLVVVDLP